MICTKNKLYIIKQNKVTDLSPEKTFLKCRVMLQRNGEFVMKENNRYELNKQLAQMLKGGNVLPSGVDRKHRYA